MYDGYRAFWADYRSVANYYEEYNRILNWVAPIDVRRAWNIYTQARNAAYGTLVMGRTTVDEPGRTPQMFGNAITMGDHQGLGVITHGDEVPHLGGKNVPMLQGGMIMHYYGNVNTPWRGTRSGYHFLYNDAWLLGGAHRGAEFNLASPRWRINLWDDHRAGLTATGRETVFLDAHGYEVISTGARRDRGTTYESFVSMYPARARAATFQSLVASLRRITRVEQLRHLITPGAPVPAAAN